MSPTSSCISLSGTASSRTCGSVRLVVNATDGTVAQRLDYDEFGRVTTDSSPGFQPFGFAGRLYDHRSGLVLFSYRVYDPFTGRFLTRDPLWHGGGHSNLYLYVANDSVNFIDPDGLLPVWVPPAIIVATVIFLKGHTPQKDGRYGKVTMSLDVKNGRLTINKQVGGVRVLDVTTGAGNAINRSDLEHIPQAGPIPAGKYFISPNDLVIWGWPEAYYRRFIRDMGDWRGWRARINKISFNNKNIKRDEFFIHGGDNPVSLGCIDTGGGIWGNGDSGFAADAIEGAQGDVTLDVH